MNSRDYAIRRIILTVPTVLLVTVLTFLLTRLAGSPVAMYATRRTTEEQMQVLRELYHLDEPLYVQYWYWLEGILRGDWGWSHEVGAPVFDVLVNRITASMEVAILAIIIGITIAATLGTLSGRYNDTKIDHFSRAVAVAGMSTPAFWAALLLIYVFYLQFPLFPLGRADFAIYETIAHPTGLYTVDAVLAGSLSAFLDAIHHLILPAFVVGYAQSASVTRHLRSEIIEKKNAEYVDAARARGLLEDVVYRKHIRRNALIPVVTAGAVGFGFLFRGLIVVELVFGWPGLGNWMALAAVAGDYASVQGFILFSIILTIAINLSVDIWYTMIDPRVELGE